MNLWVSISVIFIVSLVLAIKSASEEFKPPKEVTKIKIRKAKRLSGVILFLKKKIIHYSSNSS